MINVHLSALVIGTAVPVLFGLAVDNTTERRKVALLIAAGALIIAPALVVELLLFAYGQKYFDPRVWTFLEAFVVAALIEELLRLFAIQHLLRREPLQSTVDALKLGIWISVGFAIVENVLYLIDSEGTDALMLAAIRILMPTVMHAISGVILAAGHANLTGLRPWSAFILAVIFHGLYDWVLAWKLGLPLPLAVLALGFVVAGIGVRTARKSDSIRQIGERLGGR